MAEKNTYKITLQTADGGEDKIELQGTEAKQDKDGRLVIKDGNEQVGSFIRVLSWMKA